MPQVVVTIDPQGGVKVEANHCRGIGCSQLTKSIEYALGAVTSDVKKPEFFQPSNQNQAANAEHRR